MYSALSLLERPWLSRRLSLGKVAYSVSPAVREQRRAAALRHGAQSGVYLSPLVVSMKKGLLARMGLRQRDLTWGGRELLDVYCRAKAKVSAIDAWLEVNPVVDGEGNPAPVLKVYFVALNSSVRTLAELRNVVAAMAREDQRFDRALTALAAEGRRVREENGDG